MQKSQENTCARVSFPIKLQASCNFIKNEALVQVFSCGFWEIFKNTFFAEDLWTTVHTFKRVHTFKHFSVQTFTKEKKQTHPNWFLIKLQRAWILGSKHYAKYFLKILPMTLFISWRSFMVKMIYDSKYIFENVFYLVY